MIPAAEVDAALTRLRLQPSIVVASGNGRHCYWKFKEAICLSTEPVERLAQIERIELALKQLSDLLGGDMKITQVSALMRLPGSHNTKFDQCREVELVSRNDLTYELDALEEWLSETSPVILRKIRPVAWIEPNPWLAIAERLGCKQRIDVEKRLAAMVYMGGGDSGVHATQLAVSASLLNQGTDIEEVVAMLMRATRAAAGEYGDRWNWGKEEKRARRMCTDWLKKHPISPPSESRDRRRPEIVHMSEHREVAQRKKKQTNVPLHIVLGEAVVGAIRGGGCDLLFTPKAAWRYADGLWSMDLDKAWLDVEIETGAQALDIESNNRLLREAKGWIVRQPDLWRDSVPWDAHRQIPTRSGLVDPKTLAVTAPRPAHYCTWRIDCEFDPAAAAPWWTVMIGDFFSDREPEVAAALIGVMQEVLGAGLIDDKPRSLSKALILQGGSNVGKSGILEVFGGLFGNETISISIEHLENAHGLMPFIKRLPWVLHEAFTQNRWHFSSFVKAMITGEPCNINVKNAPMLSQRVRPPIFWATNYPPQFKEATKAIVNRLIVIEGRTEFIEGKPIGAAAEALRRGFSKPSELVLACELSGLLNWAIAGLQRALARGFIELTDEIRKTAIDIRRDSNLVAEFIDDCVTFDRDRRLSTPDFCAAFSVWWMEHQGVHRSLPSNEAIGKAVVALADRRIAADSGLRHTHRRYYCGVKLNEDGLAFWRRARDATAFEGKVASVSAAEGDVNGWIPADWFARKSVQAMQTFSKPATVIPPTTVMERTEKTVTEKSVIGRSSEQWSPEQVVERARKPRF